MPAIANAYRGARVIGPLPQPSRWIAERRSRASHGVTADEIIHLREVEGLTFVEMSRRLGPRPNTLCHRYRLARGLA